MALLVLLKDRASSFASRENKTRLIELIRANIKLIDHNTLLGALWSFCSPVIIFIFMYSLFRNIFGESIPHYPFYLFIGITCVNYFISQTVFMLYVFSVQKEIIINSLIMRETVILASAVPHIYKLLIELGVCIVIAMWTRMLTIADILFLIPLSVSFIMMTLGVGIVVMVGFNILRDVAHVWGLIVRILFFLTPVFYSLSDINPRVATLQYWVNPLTPFICAFRDIFLVDGKFFSGVYAHCLFQGPLFLGLAYIIFLTLERTIDECV